MGTQGFRTDTIASETNTPSNGTSEPFFTLTADPCVPLLAGVHARKGETTVRTRKGNGPQSGENVTNVGREFLTGYLTGQEWHLRRTTEPRMDAPPVWFNRP